jgi:hypothetical protein
VQADVWVFEPSAALDLRVDDNYTISTVAPESVTATRVVGSLGLSRESQNTAIKGLLRVDGLLQESDNTSNELTSNQIIFLDSKVTSQRSVYGIGINFKQDTPSRDISADITDVSATAADTGASVTQDQNVARERLAITPNFEYKLSRRTTLDANLTYTQVEHELPSVEDVLLDKWIQTNGDVPPPSDLSVNTFGRFRIDDELDDFKETALTLGMRHSLSPLVTLSASVSYKDYLSQIEVNDQIVQFEEIPDPDVFDIRRKPRRDSQSTTVTVRLGFERSMSPTLKLGFSVGAYTLKKDDSDLIRADDATWIGGDLLADEIAKLTSTEQGWLGGITVSKITGVTRYSARFGVDVLPSDIGSQVESLDLVGDLVRELNPRMDFSFRARAYEPDAINATGADEFSRRFISFEPKLIWEYSRAWTVAGSYRYRRQKSRADTESGESNAFLISLKYTPPSAIRDAAAGGS